MDVARKVVNCYNEGMQAEQFMRQAIAAANTARQQGGVAIGAVLVEEATGTIIASGGSLVGRTHDPTAHAEINCIRHACAKLATDDLFAYTLYSTLEPCQMCLGCATWARIPRIYFGAYRIDVSPSLFDTHDLHDEQRAVHMNLREPTTMVVQGGVLRAACAELLGGYHDAPRHSPQAAALRQ